MVWWPRIVRVTRLSAVTALLLAAGCATLRSVPPAKVGAEQIGEASWYGRYHHGSRTASGEIFSMHQLTAAHPTLPFGTRLRVTNLSNGRSVDVRVNDRGPHVGGRIIDLSHAAARALGAVGSGVVQVRVRVLALPSRSLWEGGIAEAETNGAPACYWRRSYAEVIAFHSVLGGLSRAVGLRQGSMSTVMTQGQSHPDEQESTDGDEDDGKREPMGS